MSIPRQIFLKKQIIRPVDIVISETTRVPGSSFWGRNMSGPGLSKQTSTELELKEVDGG